MATQKITTVTEATEHKDGSYVVITQQELNEDEDYEETVLRIPLSLFMETFLPKVNGLYLKLSIDEDDYGLDANVFEE